jgi:hypothetical protein
MAVPSDIEVSRTIEYRKAVGFQLNEQPGKLKVLVGSSVGYSSKKAQIEDRFDDLTAQEKIQRNGDTPNVDVSLERRWIIKPRTQHLAPMWDRDDQLATEIDLQSPIAVNTAKAIRRAQDDRWLGGYYGNSYTGEEGATTVAFKAANIVAVNQDEGSNLGITLNKLIYMQYLMQKRFVDTESEMPIAIITSAQVKDLLKLVQVQSRDYNPGTVQALQNGKVAEFMGFRFIRAEIGNAAAYPLSSGLTVDGSGYRRVPFFVPSGMHWGSWNDFFGKIESRPDKNYSTQAYAETCGTAVRLNEDKCFQMLCNEA